MGLSPWAEGDRHFFRPTAGRKTSQSPPCERLRHAQPPPHLRAVGFIGNLMLDRRLPLVDPAGQAHHPKQPTFQDKAHSPPPMRFGVRKASMGRKVRCGGRPELRVVGCRQRQPALTLTSRPIIFGILHCFGNSIGVSPSPFHCPLWPPTGWRNWTKGATIAYRGEWCPAWTGEESHDAILQHVQGPVVRAQRVVFPRRGVWKRSDCMSPWFWSVISYFSWQPAPQTRPRWNSLVAVRAGEGGHSWFSSDSRSQRQRGVAGRGLLKSQQPTFPCR